MYEADYNGWLFIRTFRVCVARNGLFVFVARPRKLYIRRYENQPSSSVVRSELATIDSRWYTGIRTNMKIKMKNFVDILAN